MLQAAWGEIGDRGYEGFTIDAVATRAGTSKAVIYRRWSGRADLARAAAQHVLAQDPVDAPRTGSLRGDVLGVLRQLNERRAGIAMHLIGGLGEFFRETGTSVGELRDSVADGHESIMVGILAAAVDRGEVGDAPLPERVVRLPLDLMRLQLLMESRPTTDDDLVEIVDAVFLPLVRLTAGPGHVGGRS